MDMSEADLIHNLRQIRAVVDRQAEDEGLWCVPLEPGTQPIMEAYLQQELRHLHKVVEDYTAFLSDEATEDVMVLHADPSIAAKQIEWELRIRQGRG